MPAYTINMPRPVWPYPDLTPMTAHTGSGQWRRRHGGRDYYFGTIDDPAAALARWREEWPAIVAGLVPDRVRSRPSIVEILTAYLDDRERLVATGDLRRTTWQTDRRDLKIISAALGPERRVDRLTATDLDRVSHLIRERYRSPTNQQRAVSTAKKSLRWASRRFALDIDLDDLKGPTPAQIRRKRQQRRHLTAETIHAVIAHATPLLRACIMLGINAGLNQSDAAELTPEHLAREPDGSAWLAQPRAKTGVQRLALLWPETIAAIDAARQHKRVRRDLLLATRNGLAIVRDRNNGADRFDAVRLAIRKASNAAGVSASFADLRHTYQSVADSLDPPDDAAVDVTLGRTPKSARRVADWYNPNLPRTRLVRVSDHVRAWLGDPPTG